MIMTHLYLPLHLYGVVEVIIYYSHFRLPSWALPMHISRFSMVAGLLYAKHIILFY